MKRTPACVFLVTALAAAGLTTYGAAVFAQAPAWAVPALRVGIARGNGYDVAALPIEPYVARVLGGEAAPDSHPAALEALAIAVRTYALANLGRHRADGFDVCDQTHCQVVRTATPATERAARATAGKVLLDREAPASIYYSASCGGRTEIPSAVWPGADDPPFLPSRDDDACGGAPAWTTEIAASDLRRALEAAGFRGGLRDVRIASHQSSGRVARLALDGLTPPEISGQDLRVAVGRTLGWQHIRSTAFDLRRIGNAYRFTGHGSGHGVGMCVIGSGRLALQGRSATEILERYFPGLTIGTAASRLTEAPRSPERPPSPPSSLASSGADVLISLPEGDEGERAAMIALALRARDDLAKTLGVPVPSRVSLRFHPTTGAYERATGQPWFTSTVVINGEINLLPPAVLRDRGGLERSVRHALVHVLADASLSRRRLWVREGAAVHFADPATAPTEDSPLMPGSPQAYASCPGDAELEHPASIGALSTAYARARACFARQLAAGRSWRDVR
jgi:stage II sporulation protein D (peptidoglycan lytic transglycosylase)